MLITLE